MAREVRSSAITNFSTSSSSAGLGFLRLQPPFLHRENLLVDKTTRCSVAGVLLRTVGDSWLSTDSLKRNRPSSITSLTTGSHLHNDISNLEAYIGCFIQIRVKHLLANQHYTFLVSLKNLVTTASTQRPCRPATSVASTRL